MTIAPAVVERLEGVTAVTDLVSDRIYQAVFPQDGTFPAIRVQRIGEVVTMHLRSPGRAHEKLVTIRDVAPFVMTGTLNLSHGSHNNAGGDGFTTGGIVAIHRNLEERNMEIEVADGSPHSVIEFRGVISKLDLGELSLEGIQKFTAEVQPLADWTEGLP